MRWSCYTPIDLRILDRSWIVEKVTQNDRWEVVFQTLDIERPGMEIKSIPGPLESERLRDLEELDRLIDDSERYQGSGFQLAGDCLQTALLARGLGRPRIEIDGRFDSAERMLNQYAKDARFTPKALPLIRKLVWIEIQLGRIP